VKRHQIFLAILLLLSVPLQAWAESRYVTDKFEVTMRSGQGTSHKILKTLASGSRLELVEEDVENGYTLVRTSDGVEGWVLSRYLINNPVARDQLVRAQAKIKELRDLVKI
jgi:SH3 domain protein